MKLRSGALIVAVLIGVNFFTLMPDPEYKKSVQEKIFVAAKYYKDKIYYYYQKVTGQIPPQFIVNHYGDWMQFQIFCDAFLLNKRQSEDLFSVYVKSRDEAIRINYRNRRPLNDRMTHEERIALFKKRQEEIVASFTDKLTDEFTAAEVAIIDELLLNPKIAPDVELRALRAIPLNENQQKILRPCALQLVQSLENYLDGYPNDEIQETANDSFNEEKTETREKKNFLIQVNQVLSQQQLAKWKSQLIKSRESVQEYRDHQEYRGRYYFGRRRDPVTTEDKTSTNS